MSGDAEDQGLLWDANVLCDDLLDDEGFLATLGRARGVLFGDEDFDALYPSRRGRPSHPPSVLAALLLAQLFYGVSDREAERRSRLDLSWKAALGLPLDHRASLTPAWPSSGPGSCGQRRSSSSTPSSSGWPSKRGDRASSGRRLHGHR